MADDPKSEIASGAAYSDDPQGAINAVHTPEEKIHEQGRQIALNMSEVAITHGGFNKYKPEAGRADKHSSNVPSGNKNAR